MYQNGVMSGRLVENLVDAQCGTDQGGNPQYCDWKMGSANVYYQCRPVRTAGTSSPPSRTAVAASCTSTHRSM